MMPAGRYYIGDLCYVMTVEEWREVHNLITPPGTSHGSCLDGEFNLSDGRRFAMCGTAYGDGSYTDEQGRAYSVDSGSIGCIRVEDARKPQNFNLGNVVDFDDEFEVTYDDGVISIGDVDIDTDPDGEDDEDHGETVIEAV